jgi:hypothetical protein
MDPSTTQCAGMFPDAATHRGGFNVIPDTAASLEAAIALPTFSTVQSASEIVLAPSLFVNCGAAAVMQAVLTNTRTIATNLWLLFRIAEISNTNGISRHRIRRDDPISNRSQK